MFQYTAKQLLLAAKHFREHDEPTRIGRAWPIIIMDGSQWFEWFVGCLNRKITASDPRAPKAEWRNMRYETQGDLERLARAVNRPRLIVRRQAYSALNNPKIAARLAHRVSDY